MTREGLTLRQAASATGVPRATMNAWATRGLVGPTVPVGGRRRYDLLDLVRLRVARDLRATRPVSASALEAALELVAPPLLRTPEAVLVYGGATPELVEGGSALRAFLRGRGTHTLTIVPVGALAVELAAAWPAALGPLLRLAGGLDD